MKKLSLFIFFILISFSSIAQTPVFKQYYNSGMIKQECAYIDGISGKIYAEYREGTLTHGDCKFYYENGNIRSEGKYVRGVLNGLYKDYRENGLLYQIAFYDKGTSLGSRTYCDGTSLFGRRYKKGVREVSIKYNCEDNLYDNQPKGSIDFITFRNSGNIIKQLLSKDDVNFVIYDENGNVKKNMKKMSHYDLREMINFFLEDAKQWGINVDNNQNIKATFEQLEGNTIALAMGKDYDNNIIIKVDPENWQNSSAVKRWYILYHELGHDVLNLSHGEGGKMMFNFAEEDYTWFEFSRDRASLFTLFYQNYN